jgi:MFS family permease
MSSSPISIDDMPISPNIGYYNESKNNDTNINDPNYYSFNTLKTNLSSSCTKTSDGKKWTEEGTNGIYTDLISVKDFIPSGTTSLDVPYFLAKTGKLINTGDDYTDLAKNIQNNYCNANKQDVQPIVNQIQYLTCQLEKERNRKYKGDDFNYFGNKIDVREIFEQHSNKKKLLAFLLIVSIYFFVSGLFSSMDLATNIFASIDNTEERTYTYWIGLLIGLALPVIVLCYVYKKVVCTNLLNLENYEITEDPYGKITTIPDDNKKFDILTLVLFIFLLYAFVAALFTFKRKNMNNYLYSLLIGVVLFILSCFIYVLYAFVPFFNTADPNEMANTSNTSVRELRLFIDQQKEVSNITSNQYDDLKVRQAFGITFVFILFLAIVFFVMKSKNSFLNGLLGSSAILVLPVIWVLNFFLAVNYFYLFPMILLLFRFIRYIIMSVLYIVTKNGSLKESFSEDLIQKLDNFKNYSPTWGLLGVDELKLLLNVLGYKNIFSQMIVSEDNNNKNLSQNKYVSIGALGFLFNFIATKDTNNMNGIIYSVILVVLTIIISMVILKIIGEI